MTPAFHDSIARRVCLWFAAIVAAATGASLNAQWMTQQIPLAPGWNAIYLEVDSPDRKCDSVFAAYPQVESVWKYDRRFTTTQFTTDPTAPLPDPAHWISWAPKTSTEVFLRKLSEVQGGNAYLVKISDRAVAFTLFLKGTPSRPSDRWVPNTLNLAGFPVLRDNPPTVSKFFQGISQINIGPGLGSQIFGITFDARDLQIRQPDRTILKPGAAYWVKVDRFLNTSLPFSIGGDYATVKRLNFGTDRVESLLVLKNLSSTQALTLRFELLPSESAPAGEAEVAGSTPMQRFVSDPIQKRIGWQAVSAPFEIQLAAGQSQDLRLALERASLRPFKPTGTNGSAYQALLEVRELSHGIRLLVPVTAASVGNGVVPRKSPVAAPDDSPLPLYSLSQGLWVGQATIAQVNQPTFNTDADLGKDAAILRKASAPLNTRLIVHVDTNGVARLMQRAMLVWDPTAANSTSTNGQYLIYADEFSVPKTTQDVFRVSAATLPIMPPQAMSGQFGSTISGTVSLGYDDPVNPFKHQYHPDHDNLDENFSTNKLASGLESFDVSRQITLNFLTTHQLNDGSFVPSGAVLAFDGQRSSVAIDPMQLNQSATIEAWVKLDAASTNAQFLFYSAGGDSTNLYLTVGGPGTNMTFGCTSPVAPLATSFSTTNAFPIGRWTHVAAVIDGDSLKGSTEGRIYWNGQQVGSGMLNFTPGIIRNANYFGGGRDTNGFWSGSMYGFAIWNEAHDEDSVKTDMQLSYPTTAANLIAYFPADDGSGTTLTAATGIQARLQQTQWDSNASYRAAFWDIGERNGIYSETITGLRPQAILLRGTFSLQRINKDGTLH